MMQQRTLSAQNPIALAASAVLLTLLTLLALLSPSLGHAATSSRDYAYDVSGRLWRAMDGDGALITYGYDAVGNIVKIDRSNVDPNFNVLGTLPLTGGAGDLVTIQGHGFDLNLAGNQVTIGGVVATVVSVDAKGRTLVVKVPWAAESGPIAITANGKTTTAPDSFTVVHYGDTGIRGTIVSGSSESYPVELQQGQSIQIRLADVSHNGFYPGLVLNDPLEKQVATTYAADVAALSYTAASSGTFNIVVSDRSGQNVVGEYVLYYTVAPGSNEGGPLDPKNPIDGTIDLGDLDSYTFDAIAGQGFQLRVADVGKTSFHAYITVYDPNGGVVGNAAGADVAAYDFAATTTGTYTAVVFDASSGYASTGTYKIYFTRAPGSNEGGVLNPTAPIDGALDLGDIDSYTFDVKAGAGVQLRVADIAQTAFHPYLRIYDPNGAVVGNVAAADVAAYDFAPTMTGTYTAVIFDASSGYASTGTYKIYFTRAPGSNEGGALNVTAPVDGTIDVGDIDSYTFDVKAGAGVQLRVADVGQTSFHPYLRIYDPNGAVVGNAASADVAAYDFAAAISGTYTAVVFDASSGYDATGTYKIYFTQAPGSNEGGALNPTAPLDGTIDVGDIDSYTFEVTSGAGVLLRVADVGKTSFYPYLRVYDPNGAILANAQGADVAGISLAPSVSGTYTAVVFDASSGYNATGAYKIYFTQAPGSSDGGALDRNAPVDGTIDLGDIDAYSFTLKSGAGVHLRVADVAQTAFYPYLRVYDPNGAVVVNAQGANVAATSFSAPVAGTYTAVVFDNSSGYNETGAYKIYLTEAPGSNEGGALGSTTPISGTIDLGDLDSYTFQATSGVGVQLRMTDVGQTALYPYIVVYNPSGGVVVTAQGADVAATSFSPSVSGTYTAIVFDSSSGYDATGAYKLYFTEATGTSEGGALNPNTPIDGTIELGDLDDYTFDVTAGAGVHLRVVDVGKTSLYPYITVYDPNGGVVVNAQGADVAATSFSPSVSGTYAAVVFDASSGYNATGAYKIYFTQAPGSNEGGALDPTTPIDGTIDLGDLDSYTFDLAAGAGVQLRVADVGQTALNPYIVVYGPTGAAVVTASGASVAATSFTASTAGKYTAIVFDTSSGYNATGNYKLYFTRAPGSNEGGVLTAGTPVAGSIDLGDLDSYTFSAAVGDKVKVAATDVNSGALVPYVVVYGPTGTIVANASGATLATATFTATVAGSYTTVVYDTSSGYDSIGDYSLLLTLN